MYNVDFQLSYPRLIPNLKKVGPDMAWTREDYTSTHQLQQLLQPFSYQQYQVMFTANNFHHPCMEEQHALRSPVILPPIYWDTKENLYPIFQCILDQACLALTIVYIHPAGCAKCFLVSRMLFLYITGGWNN